jgi:Sec-independent protein translocase protein TatA
MNIHFSEILLILLVALLVIKPDRLPAIAYKVGRSMKLLREGINKFKRELNSHD